MLEAMSVTHAPLVTAVAFQLSAALENYQMHVDELKNPWAQAAQYNAVSRVFDEVRMLKGALPELSVDMVEVLICHVELMKALWLSNATPPESDNAALDELRDKHRQAVATMRDHCLRVFSRR
jgi:hypothetical protein